MLSSTVLKELLPAFEKKFLTFPVVKWGRQWAPIDYKKQLLLNSEGKVKVTFEDKRKLNIPLTREHLISHFSAKPEYGKKILSKDKERKEIACVWGSYGMSLLLSNDYVKFVAIDADDLKLVDLFYEHLKPQLDRFEIEYIEEYSSDDRAHFWFAVDDLESKYVSALLNQFRDNAGLDKKEWFNEQYPHEGRAKALFRLPYGWHIRTEQVNWSSFKGKQQTCIEEGLQAFIDIVPVTDDKLLSLLKEKPREKKVFYSEPEKVLLKSTLMEAPEAPEYIHNVATKCPALNKLLKYVQDEKAVVDHLVGVGLASMATYNDKIFDTEEGKEWIQSLPPGVNSPEQNLLFYYPERGGTPTCKTWETYLDWCKGCPYKGQITNPRQLFKAESLKKTKIGDIRVASLEAIREEVFPEADQVINNALTIDSADPQYILLESVQNSGKSRYADKLARRLANEGKTVCISCSSVQVAKEHKEAIELNEDGTPTGDKAFMLLSFESIFEYFSGGITCPNFEEIKDLRSLGVDSSYYKKEYCKECPFYEECNYPRQYSLVQEEKYNIVIIQHAHMACTEVIRQLMAKRFDILIVDEDFIDFLTTQLIPTKTELEILERFENPPEWLSELLNWMREGGYPLGPIKPKAKDLKPILEAFQTEKIPYRLDHFIRQFNELEYMHPVIGVMKFSPLPRIPVIVFTDATPTIEELQLVLNSKEIIRVGQGIVADPAFYHPDNKVFQILDGRTSKAEMLKREKLYEYLEFIGDKMRAEYKDLTALITVFKTYKDPETGEVRNIEEEVFEWLLRNYPKESQRIAVNHMAVGTNAWANFNVQFILAGPYVNQRQLKEETYKLKFIVNYWRRQNDLPLINNIYPTYVEDDAKGQVFKEKVRRIHRDGIYEYEQFEIPIPDPESWEYLVWKRLQAKKQQAARIRHKPGKRTDLYFMDHSNLSSMLVDEVFTESEVLGYIRSASE